MKIASLTHTENIIDKDVNEFFWSPRGRFFVLTNTSDSKGALEFWDSKELEMMGYGEHFMVTDIVWDPSGRYVTSSVSAYSRQSETGFILWNVLGRILHSFDKDKFYQFLWRPRPASLLNAKQEQALERKLQNKKKKHQLQEEEKAAFLKAQQEQLRIRRELWDKFTAMRKKHQEEYDEEHDKRTEIRGFESDKEDEYDTREIFEDEIVSKLEEVIEQ